MGTGPHKGSAVGVEAEMGSVCSQEPERRLQQKLMEAGSTPLGKTRPCGRLYRRHPASGTERSLSVAEAPCLWAASDGPSSFTAWWSRACAGSACEPHRPSSCFPGSLRPLCNCPVFSSGHGTDASWGGWPWPMASPFTPLTAGSQLPTLKLLGNKLVLKGLGADISPDLSPQGS